MRAKVKRGTSEDETAGDWVSARVGSRIVGMAATAATATTPLHLKSVTNPEHSGGTVTFDGTGFKAGDSIRWVMNQGPTTVAKAVTVTPTKLTTKAPFAPGAGTHTWSVSVMGAKSIVSNRITVKVITALQLVSISPADAYNCHMITLHGSGLVGVNLVWFGNSQQRPEMSLTSTRFRSSVRSFAQLAITPPNRAAFTRTRS